MEINDVTALTRKPLDEVFVVGARKDGVLRVTVEVPRREVNGDIS